MDKLLEVLVILVSVFAMAQGVISILLLTSLNKVTITALLHEAKETKEIMRQLLHEIEESQARGKL